MKSVCTAILLALVLTTAITPSFCQAQPAGFAITERGADWRVLRKSTVENGTNHVYSYTELMTGLNFQQNGNWTESKEQITLLQAGGAEAVQGRHKVRFPADIYNGVLEVTTPDSRILRERPLAVAWDDGSNTVFIATLTNAVGWLTASNQVTYKNCFSGIKADLVCDYKRSGFECSLVFRAQPPTPDACGLDSASSTLQLITEFFNTQDPEEIPAAYDEWYGLQDSTLKFGKLTMTQGKAFGVKITNAAPATINHSAPVYKRWLTLDGRKFLIEELPVIDIAEQLDALPLTASLNPKSHDPKTKTPGKILFASRNQFPPSHEFVADTNQILIASLDSNHEPGVVLDYSTVDMDQTNFTFYTGETYVVSDFVYLSGVTEFQGSTVVKFTSDGSIKLDPSSAAPDGNMAAVWPESADRPAIFTSIDDNSVGTPIGSGSPTVLDTAFFTYDWCSWASYDAWSWKNLRVRYAGCFIKDGSGGSEPGIVISDSQFGDCNVVLADFSGSIQLNNDLFKNCQIVIVAWSGATITGENITVDQCGSFNADPSFNGNWVALHNSLVTDVADFTTASDFYYVAGYYAHLNLINTLIAGHLESYNTNQNSGRTYDLPGCLSEFAPTITQAGCTTTISSPLNSSLISSATGIYTSAAGASNYLAGSSYRNVGTTNIDSGLLAQLQTLTTYAPQDGGYADTNPPDLGYHYPVNEDSDHDGLPDWWELKYFGNYTPTGSQLDSAGGTNTLHYDYQHTNDPNVISFSFSFPNQYVSTNIVSGIITVLGGVPSSIAVLVDSTNFTAATWTAYTTSNLTVNISTNQGAHDVWIGLRGLPSDAQQTWEETTLVLASAAATISITNPGNNVSFNSSRVNVSGYYTSAALKQITVNGVLAFIHGTNFDALNVPLDAGTNLITALLEDLTGGTNFASINVITTTNSNGTLNDPVQLQATPSAGFAPLTVTFQVQTNAPGTFQQAAYDFNGDSLADFVTNNLDSLASTYATNGEYFPVVTIQTTAGRFSSVGGWNAVTLDETNQPIRINVQTTPTVTTFASITDPVDLKWVAPSNLYVLSRSTATITEFSTNGSTTRSLSGLGTNPSGFDVDAAGNVYVAVTASNQVWKFYPTNATFAADTNFAGTGFVGTSDGTVGTGSSQFNAPFDVAVNPDGGTIAVSDSGNNRIQQFSANGAFIASFGSSGSAVGQFSTPKGLTYDSTGTLYIVDSGNNRIVLAQGSGVVGVSGTNGTALGQFSGPVNMSIGTRGVYVADTGNNRIQKFNSTSSGLFSITPASIDYAVTTNLSGPYAVAAVNNFTNDLFYVTDTGNNRVILCTAPSQDADAILAVWNHMTSRIAAGDIPGAIPDYSVASEEKYQQAFLSVGTTSTISAIGQIGTLIPATIEDDTAQYYFEQIIDGETITFPVEFTKENGVWKILEF